MHIFQTSRFHARFHPFVKTEKAQAAYMQLPPAGTSDDEVGNEHPHSEQWLFVVAGMGAATVVSRDGNRRRVKLQKGSLLVIQEGELHQIRNTGKQSLATINLYVPPAYRADGQLRRLTKGKV